MLAVDIDYIHILIHVNIYVFQTEAVVENSVIKDSFARSILLYKSPDVQYSNVHLERAPGNSVDI